MIHAVSIHLFPFLTAAAWHNPSVWQCLLIERNMTIVRYHMYLASGDLRGGGCTIFRTVATNCGPRSAQTFLYRICKCSEHSGLIICLLVQSPFHNLRNLRMALRCVEQRNQTRGLNTDRLYKDQQRSKRSQTCFLFS